MLMELFWAHILLQQMISKKAVTVKVSKGEMPEWETKLGASKMADANGLLWV